MWRNYPWFGCWEVHHRQDDSFLNFSISACIANVPRKELLVKSFQVTTRERFQCPSNIWAWCGTPATKSVAARSKSVILRNHTINCVALVICTWVETTPHSSTRHTSIYGLPMRRQWQHAWREGASCHGCYGELTRMATEMYMENARTANDLKKTLRSSEIDRRVFNMKEPFGLRLLLI